MISQTLAGLLLRQPFQPFAFVLGGWDVGVHVDRPEQVRHKPGDRIAVVMGSDGGESSTDLDQVALITVKPKGRRW